MQFSQTNRSEAALTWALGYVLLAALVTRFFVITGNEINWDEFYYLAQVYMYGRGEHLSPFQTLHVHLFGWLRFVSDNEAAQVVAGRAVMLGLQGGSCYFLYSIARAFYSKNAALFAVVSYMSFTFVIWQGESFRTDPIATCLLMGALYAIVLHPVSYRHAVLAGLLIGTAGMVTIKSVLMVPTIGMILLLSLVVARGRGDGWKRPFKYGMLCGMAAAVALGALFVLHGASLATAPEGADKMVAHSISKTINFSDLFPGWMYIRHSLGWNPGYWLFLALGIGATIYQTAKAAPETRMKALKVLAFALPLLSLVFYRNAFPYYYGFMLAPVSVLCAAGWEAAAQAKGRPARFLLYAALLVCLGNVIGNSILRSNVHPLDGQRQVIAAIHDMFPQPVSYLDRCAMVGSFPRTGFFMSTWGLENYRRRAQPLMEKLITENQPVFMLANIPQLDVATAAEDDIPESYRLLPEDRKTLQENYLPFWGPVYLAGKHFAEAADGRTESFDLLVGGPYTVESQAPVTIDGMQTMPGAVIELSPGPHELRIPASAGEITLRWGDHLLPPAYDPPSKPVFSGF